MCVCVGGWVGVYLTLTFWQQLLILSGEYVGVLLYYIQLFCIFYNKKVLKREKRINLVFPNL